MPRAERQLSKTGIYHVMLRGINKQLIFEEPEDYSQFLSFLYQRFSSASAPGTCFGSIGNMAGAGICSRTGFGASR